MVVSFIIAVPFALAPTLVGGLTPATNTTAPIRHRLLDFFEELSGTPVVSDPTARVSRRQRSTTASAPSANQLGASYTVPLAVPLWDASSRVEVGLARCAIAEGLVRSDAVVDVAKASGRAAPAPSSSRQSCDDPTAASPTGSSAAALMASRSAKGPRRRTPSPSAKSAAARLPRPAPASAPDLRALTSFEQTTAAAGFESGWAITAARSHSPGQDDVHRAQ